MTMDFELNYHITMSTDTIVFKLCLSVADKGLKHFCLNPISWIQKKSRYDEF